jgi:hypothetical protein
VNDLLASLPLPEGFTVHKDITATDEWGDRCVRVMVTRRVGRQRHTTQFTVPIYKTVGYRRTGLFSFEVIELTDHDRIDRELKERGERAMRQLLDTPASE